jgi:hypothetical protein
LPSSARLQDINLAGLPGLRFAVAVLPNLLSIMETPEKLNEVGKI